MFIVNDRWVISYLNDKNSISEFIYNKNSAIRVKVDTFFYQFNPQRVIECVIVTVYH